MSLFNAMLPLSPNRGAPPPTQGLFADPAHLLPAATQSKSNFNEDGDHEELLIDGTRPYLLYAFNLGKGTITRHRCSGAVPAPRFEFASAVVGNRLYLFGGAAIQPSSGSSEGFNTPCPPVMHVLNLDTLIWSDVPQPRTQQSEMLVEGRWGHTMVSVGREVVIFGGQRNSRTAADACVLRERGFYYVHAFDTATETWRQVSHSATGTPIMPFGHSTVVLSDRYLVNFGGFAMDLPSARLELDQGSMLTPPAVRLSREVFVFDMLTEEWSTEVKPVATGRHGGLFSPPEAFLPAPRANHRAVACSGQLIVVGGVTVTASGHAHPLFDAWCFDVTTNTWAKLEFCSPEWATLPLIFTEPNDDGLVVVSDLVRKSSLSFRESEQSMWVSNYMPPTEPRRLITEPTAKMEGIVITGDWVVMPDPMLVRDAAQVDDVMDVRANSSSVATSLSPPPMPFNNMSNPWGLASGGVGGDTSGPNMVEPPRPQVVPPPPVLLDTPDENSATYGDTINSPELRAPPAQEIISSSPPRSHRSLGASSAALPVSYEGSYVTPTKSLILPSSGSPSVAASAAGRTESSLLSSPPKRRSASQNLSPDEQARLDGRMPWTEDDAMAMLPSFQGVKRK